MKINNLNGDSTVTGVVFQDGRVRCKFIDGETGAEYEISIPTDRFYSAASSEEGTVHIRIVDLAEKLPIDAKSQRYMAPEGFAAQMRVTFEGLIMAVGLHSKEWPLFLQIRGNQMLVACPIMGERDVDVRPLKEEA